MNSAFNVFVAWVNLCAAGYWIFQGEPGLAVFACVGALCSLKAVEWARE